MEYCHTFAQRHRMCLDDEMGMLPAELDTIIVSVGYNNKLLSFPDVKYNTLLLLDFLTGQTDNEIFADKVT